MKNKFAERFKELLRDKELTQSAFAKKYGFAQKTVNDWCLGLTHPSFDTLMFICKEFRETSDYMLGLED